MSLMYAIVGLCCLAFAAAAPSEIKKRSIGSEAAYIGEIPYQVSLRRNLKGLVKHACGGSLITKRHVLTAGHCVNRYLEGGDRVDEYKNLTVYVGSVSNLVGGQEYFVENITLHEAYDDNILTNDIAVIKLTEEVELSAMAKIIPLSTETDVPENTTMLVSGFGAFMEAGFGGFQPTAFLRKLNVKSITREECKEFFREDRINEFQLCTSTANKTGTCSGDSGGPLVYKGKQIGIVSFGTTICAGGIPNVFTIVAHYRYFIDDCIANM